MTPQTTVQASPEAPPVQNRRRAIVVGAVLVAAMIVGTGAFMVIPHPQDAAGREGLAEDQTLATPEAVVAQAQAVLPTLAAGTDAAEAAVLDAQQQLDNALLEAQSAVTHHAAAQGAVLATVVAETGDLPYAPSGWVPGTDAARFVGQVSSIPYTIPAIQTPTDLGQTLALADHTVSGTFATGTSAPRTGVAEVDALTHQLGIIDSTYSTLFGQDLTAVLGGLGAPGVPALPAGLGAGALPGLTQPGDAAHTVGPDGEGANNALAFGYGLTDSVTDSFGDLTAQADAVLATHTALVAQVEALAAEARTLEADGVAGIEAQLQQRLQETEATAQAQIQALQTARDAYVLAVQATHAQVQAELDAQISAAESVLTFQAQAQIEALAETAASIQTDAMQRSAAVEAQAQDYLDLLADMGASGVDVTADVAAVQAETERLQALIEAETAAGQELLLGAAEELQAQALVQVAQLQAHADLLSLQPAVDDALATADHALAFGQAIALATRTAVLDANIEGAAATTASLQAEADAQIQGILASANGYLAGSQAFAASGTALVAQVQGDAEALIHDATGYVREVAEDYATVPEPERQATAEALLAEANTLSTIGLGVVASGSSVAAQFAAVAQSSANVQGTLATLPL